MTTSIPQATIVVEVPMGDAAVPRLELSEWAARYGLVAGITTRAGGFSLGLWSEEPTAQVMTRWRAFRRAFESGFPTVVLGHQVHGTDIKWHANLPPGWLVLDGVDGHATRDRGTLLAITVADCIPVYLAAPERGIVALLHAGWRGVAGGILERALGELTAATGATCRDFVMHCGVGVCGNCYEVGYEVSERVTGRPPTVSPAFVDLRGLLAGRGAALGVSAVSISAFCSAHHNDQFFSHRASLGRDGRMVAYLGMPLAST
ncbi:MAG TPA: polyphenol oxidase family protein [Gemmatimonadales bacterium]|nr:polyphenol oxidase family protein [Gemmatimonadales bacterium]